MFQIIIGIVLGVFICGVGGFVLALALLSLGTTEETFERMTLLPVFVVVFSLCGSAGGYFSYYRQHQIDREAAGGAVLFARKSPEHADAMRAVLNARNVDGLEEALRYRMVGVVGQAQTRLRLRAADQLGQNSRVSVASNASIDSFGELVK